MTALASAAYVCAALTSSAALALLWVVMDRNPTTHTTHPRARGVAVLCVLVLCLSVVLAVAA